MKTEKRIEKLAEGVKLLFERFDRKVVVADIATDHGYLSERLSKESNVEKIIATDISEKSLSKLIRLKEKYNLEKIDPKLGNGLAPIEKVDIAVIAGIGAYEIMKILSNQNITNLKEFKCKYFVLQPAQNIVQLREWVCKKHYKLIKDFIVKDGKQYYPILVIDVSKFQFNIASVKNLWLGFNCDLNDIDYKNFIIDTYENLQFIEKLPQKRVKNDEILCQKCKLLRIIKKQLQC